MRLGDVLITETGISSPLSISPAVQGLKRGRVSVRQRKRIDRCRDFEEFCKEYLPHHFTKPFGEHHHDLISLIECGAVNRRLRVVRAEPREFGKSTFMIVAAPLYWLAYRLKWYIVLFGSTHDAIFPHYSALQDELEPNTQVVPGETGVKSSNEKLLSDFPHLRPMLDFKGQFISWTDYRMRLVSGATVECRGIMSKFRGLKMKQYRPDAMIIDDPQDEEDVATFFRREKLARRFRRTILNLGGENCDIFVVGNLMHKESLIAKLLKSPNWDGKLYQAINLPRPQGLEFVIGNTKKDGSALWPERWPKEVLDRKKEEMGSERDFALEFLNLDKGEEDVIYDSSAFMRFDHRRLNLKGFQVVGWWDPSDPGVTAVRDSDYPCIVIVATRQFKFEHIDKLLKALKVKAWTDVVRKPYEGMRRWYFVCAAYIRKDKPEGQVEAALDLLERYPVSKLWYEDNGGWGMIRPYLQQRAKERGVALPLKLFSQSKNKVQRIMKAQPVINSRVVFDKNLSFTYFSQFDDFPNPSAHDDAPDATVAVLDRFESRREGRRPFAF